MPVRRLKARLSKIPEGFNYYSPLVTAIATVVIAVATLAYFYVSRDQLQAFKRTESARIGIPRVDGELRDALRDATVFLPVENYGRITSPNVSITVVSTRWPKGNIPGFPAFGADYHQRQDFGGLGTQIPPGNSKFGITARIGEGSLAESEIQKIEKGESILVIFAHISYDNGFGEIQKANACFEYDSLNPKFPWTLCPTQISLAALKNLPLPLRPTPQH